MAVNKHGETKKSPSSPVPQSKGIYAGTPLDKNKNPPPLWLKTLIGSITLIAVVVVIFFGSLSYLEKRRIVAEEFNHQQLILARSTAASIETYIRELEEGLLSLAKLPTIQRMSPECLMCMQHTYWGFLPKTSIRLLDRNGLINFIYPFDGWRGELIGRDYGEEHYFQEVKETGRISVSGLIINEQGEPRIRIAVPVYLESKKETIRVGNKSGIIVSPLNSDIQKPGRVQGVLIGSCDPYTIAQHFILSIESGKTGYAWLLDEEGVFLAHHEEGFTGRNAIETRQEKNPEISYELIENIQQKMMSGEEGTGCHISGQHRGQKGEIEKLIAYTPVHIGDHIWSVGVCAPVSEVEEIINRTKRSEQSTLFFVILLLIAGGAFFFITSSRWSRSLELEVLRRTKELKETTDYLDNLIRHANAPIIVWNPDKKITIFNEAFEKMSGWNELEISNKSLDVLFPEESRSDSMQKIENTLKGEYWESVEIPILCKNGVNRLALWNSANIYSDDGKILIATIAQGEDITIRKQNEELLRESEELWRTMIELSNDMIWNLDCEGNFTFISQHSEELSGYRSEELLGKSFVPLIVEEDLALVENVFQRTLNGETQHYEVRVKHKNGSILILSVNTSLLLKAGEVVGTVSFGNDITKRKLAEQTRKRAEEELEKRQNYLESLLHETPDAILTLDGTHRIIEWNPGSEQIFGYTRLEVIGKDIDSVITCPDVMDEAVVLTRSVLSGEKVLPKETVRYRKDGTPVNVILAAAPIKIGDEYSGAVVVYTDITEQKRSEERVRNSLREKEVLLKEIHHRVKNNLQIISSLLSLQSKFIKDKQALDMFQESRNRVLSMALIHEMLYQSEDMAKIDFTDYIRNLAVDLYHAYVIDPDKIDLTVEGENIFLGLDQAITCGLVSNELVSNALKHAFPSSRKGRIQVHLHQSDENEIELIVEDNGIGIPEEINVMETKSLGLELVTLLVGDQLKGKIELDRSGGTKFQINFKVGA
ncbi:MAG: PAS domain S-box protein [Spirochaetales bacterium]|nr:PAS domain S-box protein [Spirochaetales bacterium]